jgi:hypothetical protein
MGLNERVKFAFWNIKDDRANELYRIEAKPFENHPTNFTDERVNIAVKYHNEKWFHNEVIVKANKAIVEPQYGYAVDGLSTIIGASIRNQNNFPSPIPMLKAKFLGRKLKLNKAILFDGSMGVNYFHFLSDVLSKIYLLEKFTEIDCPLLVGEVVWSKPYFQYLISETRLSKYDWQPIKQPVEVWELFISRPMPYRNEYWQKTKALLVSSDNLLSERKAIFINRTGTRHITNFREIKAVLGKHSVEVVDPGNMNMKHQAELFSSASHVIGIHGAGMTNVVFCNHPKVKVLELCSNNRIGTQYYWLCQTLGINWDMMLGSEANADQSFELNAEKLDERLRRLLLI